MKKWCVTAEIIVDADTEDEAEREAYANPEADWTIVSTEEVSDEQDT